MREQAPLKAPKMAKNNGNDHIIVFTLLTWKKDVMKQFFETVCHLKSCLDKLSSIAEKFGYPWGMEGKKIAQK